MIGCVIKRDITLSSLTIQTIMLLICQSIKQLTNKSTIHAIRQSINVPTILITNLINLLVGECDHKNHV